MYGHRVSVDLDFFSDADALDFVSRQILVKDLLACGAEVEEEKNGTLHARHRGTHLSFFHYAYPLLRPARPWGRIRVAQPADIGLMKIGAVIGRGGKKDFLDLYTVLSRTCSLAQLLRLSKKKFKGARDFPSQACRALVYFDDADPEPLPRLNKPPDWGEVKRFFEREVRKIVSKWQW